ncbi:MAG: PD-(D/E)XK nuclease family protein [Bacillota bacterium]|jgi:CRISPR/Cas system-associated exonuclease Cas4 (RecB family)|nr:PD-(D/E)XK nuclease family protein [Bacillota bacterium]
MAGYVRREYPEWSWSFSRQQTLASCPRRYYYNYYGSHNGWEMGAPQEAALAYRLKKLSNLYIVLGDALHKSAYHMVERVREGRPLPDADVAEEEIRRQLRRVWKSSRDDLDLFIRRPNRVDMLHEFYYRMEISDATLARINERIRQAAEGLVSSDVWDELGQAGTEIIAFEQFDTFLIDETPVYAVPDLLYKTAAGQWRIVDWKTGVEAEDNQDQVALYALYVNKKHGVAAGQIAARLEYLSLQTSRELTFTPADLEKVEGTARASMEEMRRLLLDPVRNVPRPKEAFALTDERGLCPWCNFFELCKEELELSVS